MEASESIFSPVPGLLNVRNIPRGAKEIWHMKRLVTEGHGEIPGPTVTEHCQREISPPYFSKH